MNLSIENRNEAFRNIVETLPQKRAKIFTLIAENQPCTIQQLCKVSLLPINEISGRITELKNACLIIEQGKRENANTRHSNTLYKVANPLEKYNLYINRKMNLLRDKEELMNHLEIGSTGIVSQLINKQLKKVLKELEMLNKIKIDT